MTETAAGAASVIRMSDPEKLLDRQRSAVHDMPDKTEPQEPSPCDAKSSGKPEDTSSSDKAKDTAEKKSEGSLRDYFVSAERH